MTPWGEFGELYHDKYIIPVVISVSSPQQHGTSLIARLKLKPSRRSDLMHGHDVDDDNRKRVLTEAAGQNKEDYRNNYRLVSPRPSIPAIISVSSWIDIQPQLFRQSLHLTCG